jgi:2-dehydropantoate 2-reductase
MTLDVQSRVLVVGLGGIGGVVTALLSARGLNVTAITNNARITDAVRERGLRADGVAGLEQVVVHAVTSASALAGEAPFDACVLAVPPNAALDAVRAASPLLRAEAPLLVLQNGLVEERLAPIVGADRVVGCIVGFGATMHGPGHVERTSEGGFVLGRLTGETDDVVRAAAALLDGPLDATTTTNLRGARWSKLAINCAISSLGTIGGDRLGALMRHRFGRRLCLEVMTEAVQVAVASEVRLEKLAGTIDLEWLALDAEERTVQGSPSLFAKHTVLLAVGARYRKLRSSMLAALERGREPPVDFLNGEIVERAARVGVPVPVNAAVVEAVKALARRERRPSLAALRQLFDETRPALRELRLAA